MAVPSAAAPLPRQRVVIVNPSLPRLKKSSWSRADCGGAPWALAVPLAAGQALASPVGGRHGVVWSVFSCVDWCEPL